MLTAGGQPLKEKASHLKRPRRSMPDDIKKALHADGLMDAYLKETPIPAERLPDMDCQGKTGSDHKEKNYTDAG